MKRMILIPMILFVLAACKNDKAKVESSVIDNTGEAISTSSKHDAMKTEASTTKTSQTSGTATKPAKKKGWSNGAKGAVIGAGTGAVVGAVADKNHRARGAVLGAAVGTGAGYIIGDNIKKKDTLSH
jgi:YmgG-like glycine-zipper protein